MKVSGKIQHIVDLQSEEDVFPLGTKAEIFALLKNWFPEANYHDPEWISLHNGDISEIIVSGANELGDNDVISSLGFRNPSYRLLRDVCAKMDWKAFNPSDGEFIDFASVPSDYFNELTFRKSSPLGTYGLPEFFVYLRNQVLETWKRGDKSELRNLAVTLKTLKDSISKSGDSTYWTLVDNLTYFAWHADLADYTLYVPTEQAIRDLGAK